MNLLLWIVLFVPAFLLAFLCRIISPFLCPFIVREFRLDTVKRLGKKKVTLPRDNLTPLFWGFNTHDNNTDEWWYGVYNVDSFWFCRNWTQEDYDASAIKRWFCRVMWLQRNSAYGFNYAWFSRPLEPCQWVRSYGIESKGFWISLALYAHSFQFECHIPYWPGRYNSINIGWKAHKGHDKKIYAGRILGLKKY